MTPPVHARHHHDLLVCQSKDDSVRKALERRSAGLFVDPSKSERASEDRGKALVDLPQEACAQTLPLRLIPLGGFGNVSLEMREVGDLTRHANRR